MGEPALRDPTPLPRVLLDRAAEGVRARMEPRLNAAVAAMRSSQPAPGSDHELSLVGDFTRVVVGVFFALEADDFHDVLREDLNGQVDALVVQEYKAAELTRKLSYRHLVQSLEVLGRLFEVWAGAADFIVAARDLIGDLRDTSASPQDDEDLLAPIDVEPMLQDPSLRATYTLLLLISVALETREATAEEFAYWAKRAVECARRLDVMLPHVARKLEGTAARFRAERAWLEWDEQEIESELTEWSRLVE
jgi:hypothetical protein